MEDPRSFMIGCFIPASLFMLLTFSGCSMYFNALWKGAVPQQIKLGNNLARTTDIIGSPGGGCGGAIFRLKEITANEIREKGITFFDKLSQPRKGNASSISWSVSNSQNRGEISFQCVINTSNNKAFYRQKMQNAFKSPHSYYGVMSGKAFNTRILIMPEDRLVFIGYWD